MTNKEIEDKRDTLITIVNMSSGTENERLKELRKLAVEVGASHLSVTGNRTANEGELVFNIQNALQTASMLNGCKAANKSAVAAIVSAVIAAIATCIALITVLSK